MRDGIAVNTAVTANECTTRYAFPPRESTVGSSDDGAGHEVVLLVNRASVSETVPK
jgi:hypothetical protein